MPCLGEHLLKTVLHDVNLAEDLNAMAHADQAALAEGRGMTFPINVIHCLAHCDNYFTDRRRAHDKSPGPSVILNAKPRDEMSLEIREGYMKLVTMTAFLRNEILHPLIAILEQMKALVKLSPDWIGVYVQRQELIRDAKIELKKMLDICAQQDLRLLKFSGNQLYAREEEK